MDLVPHLWESLITGPVDVTIEFHEPLSVDAVGGRKKLAALAEEMVRGGQVRALAGIAAEPEKVPQTALPAAGLPQAAE
jgi:1-acyl-sn-glycerol-3-phosphate acyltransferase